mgnify:CR=1 FL=1
MITLKEYMTQVGVTKPKYVQQWIDLDLIPGITRGDSLKDTLFPESARRPYCERWLNPGLHADRIRAHIVKACLQRRHITNRTFFISEGEFNGYIRELEEAELIRTREEDGIVYYDSTTKSNPYREKGVEEIRKFIIDVMETIARGFTRGATEAIIERYG